MGQNEEYIVSTNELCQIFGVTRMTTSTWRKSGCPQVSRGTWNLPDVIKWKFEGQPTKTPETEDPAILRARKLQADTEYREERAQRERLLREVLEDMYFKRTDVEEAWAQRATEAKMAFLIFEKTLPVELYGKSIEEMETIIASRVREVLMSYARRGRYCGESHSAGTSERINCVDAAGKIKSERVGRPKQSSRQ